MTALTHILTRWQRAWNIPNQEKGQHSDWTHLKLFGGRWLPLFASAALEIAMAVTRADVTAAIATNYRFLTAKDRPAACRCAIYSCGPCDQWCSHGAVCVHMLHVLRPGSCDLLKNPRSEEPLVAPITRCDSVGDHVPPLLRGDCGFRVALTVAGYVGMQCLRQRQTWLISYQSRLTAR